MQDTESSVLGAISHADPDDIPTPRHPWVAADWQLFEYVESGQISPTAVVVYLLLLKRRNGKRADKRVWPSRETLAKELNLSRPESVDPYLKQLRDAGLISWEKWHIGGMRARNRYTCHLIADLKSESEKPESSVPPKTAQRTPLQRASGTPWTEDELDTGELPEDELDPTKERERTAPPPLASLSSAAAPENPSQRSSESWAKVDQQQRRSEPVEDWRQSDRELFRSYVGSKVRTDGTLWGKDGEIFTADAFYNAYRKLRKKRMTWPGRFLAKIEGDGRDIADWMIDQGLEMVE